MKIVLLGLDIQPDTPANMPILSPVRAITGVPRQVATNSPAAMGIYGDNECGHFLISEAVPRPT